MDLTHPLAPFSTRSPRAAERLAVAQECRATARPQDPASPVLAAVELIGGAASALDGLWSPAECDRLRAAMNLLLDMEAERVERHTADLVARLPGMLRPSAADTQTNPDIAAARALVNALAKDGDRAWRMCVPPQSDDADVLLSRVIDRAEAASRPTADSALREAQREAFRDGAWWQLNKG